MRAGQELFKLWHALHEEVRGERSLAHSRHARRQCRHIADTLRSHGIYGDVLREYVRWYLSLQFARLGLRQLGSETFIDVFCAGLGTREDGCKMSLPGFVRRRVLRKTGRDFAWLEWDVVGLLIEAIYLLSERGEVRHWGPLENDPDRDKIELLIAEEAARCYIKWQEHGVRRFFPEVLYKSGDSRLWRKWVRWADLSEKEEEAIIARTVWLDRCRKNPSSPPLVRKADAALFG